MNNWLYNLYMSYILIIKYTKNFKLLVLRRVWINSNSPILEDR